MQNELGISTHFVIFTMIKLVNYEQTKQMY